MKYKIKSGNKMGIFLWGNKNSNQTSNLKNKINLINNEMPFKYYNSSFSQSSNFTFAHRWGKK